VRVSSQSSVVDFPFALVNLGWEYPVKEALLFLGIFQHGARIDVVER
jgi:hypothetical protein